MIHAKLADAQAELHILKTYKDKEYPVKVLMITDIKREIAKLEETQQVSGTVHGEIPQSLKGLTSLDFIQGLYSHSFM